MATTTGHPDGTEADPAIRNYQDLYAKTNWLEKGVSVQQVFALFDTSTSGSHRTGPQLFDEVKRTAMVMPHAYVMAIRGSTHLAFYHRAIVLPAMLGAPAEDWHDKILAFGNDVMETQMPQAVILPPQFLSTAAATLKVHNLPDYLLHYQVAQEGPLEAVPDDAPAGTYKEVLPRRAMYVPPEMAGFFLSGPTTALRALVDIHQYLGGSSDDLVAPYQPLIDWLRAVATEGGLALVEYAAAPASIQLTPGLTKRLLALVREDLPDWQAPPSQGNYIAPAVVNPDNQATQAMLELLTQLIANQQGPPVDKSPTTVVTRRKPSEFWRSTYDTLLRVTQATTDDDLPAIWHDLAACDKRERRLVLQNALSKTATALNLTQPVATVTLAEAVTNLEFASPFVDNLHQGWQPFATIYLDGKTMADLKEVTDVHETLASGATSNLRDVLDLKKAAKLSLPTNDKQTRKTLEGFGVLLAVVLGTSSTVFRTYRREVLEDFEFIADVLDDLEKRQHVVLPYTRYVRAIQLEMVNYWRELERTSQTAPPAFADVNRQIKRRAWIAPALPPEYLPSKSKPPSMSAAPAEIRVQQSQSDDPQLPGPTHTFYRDESPKSDIMDLGAKIGSIGEFLKRTNSGRSPFTKAGVPLCLAWHLRGGCYADCARRDSHTPLTVAEHKKLLKFLRDNTAKNSPAVPTTQPPASPSMGGGT